ncbi:ArgR family transcriptional regulator [Anaplasmataceae bacterium AB001_6]|nr:ArgR family transcriptional regulator [Anaplasmataceae bacterium AB001_6]
MNKNKDINNHIFDLIRKCNIKEQSELQDYLEKRGYQIPQATLSRKLKKLNIVKISGRYSVISNIQNNLPLILSVNISDFGLMTLHTYPGNGNAIAAFLDKKYVSVSFEKETNYPILATIAGDDTILLVIKNKKSIKDVLRLLSEDFPYIKIPKFD